MGLALAKRIIEAHNGVLELRSIVGKGTQVTISLPALTE
jgi:signal transduction histidine kinase